MGIGRFRVAGFLRRLMCLASIQGVGTDILRLVAWTGVAVAVLVLPLWRDTVGQHRRETSVHAEAFAAPTPPFAKQS